MAKKKINTGLVSRFNLWINDKSEGNEKKWIVGMIVIALIMFSFTLFQRYSNPKKDKLTIKETIEMVKEMKPESTIGFDDAARSFSEMKKTEKGVEIIEQLQIELDKKVLDTVKIKNLYEELQSLGINIPLK